MGDHLDCPLCCNAKFNSKQALVEHLSNISSNLICPICQNTFSLLEHLTEHLKLDSCDAQTLSFEEVITVNVKDNKFILNMGLDQSNDATVTGDMYESHEPNTINLSTIDENSDMSKMYVELLSKQLMKPCLQTQEVKLVKEDGESRYLILTDEDSVTNTGNAVVTKQNNDGTISLTTMKDSNLELVKEAPVFQQEYSCNTCGVSFTSVEEHIKKYHNDQDVVVEEAADNIVSVRVSLPVQSAVSEEIVVDKQISRRMITDTGDIIEEPFVKDEQTGAEPTETFEVPVKRDRNGKTRVYTRRYVQVEKFCNSVVQDIEKADETEGPYHKVVMKEMISESGDTMKVYNCLSCNGFVTSLSEFKSHPCKTLKYSCSQCPVVYDNAKSLCAHMKIHKVRPVSETPFTTPKKFECEICSTIFPTSKSLKLHKRMHDPIKSRPIEPPVETSDGSAVSNIKFLCTTCDKLIPIDYRAIHQNSHKATNKMICDICNKKFHSKEYLEMHMSVHNIDKVPIVKQDQSLPYDCLYCNRKFARPHEKVKHERIHTGEKPHSCEICGKAFRVSYCLTLHMRTHTGARPYACPHCNKRFKAHSVYNHHLLTHSDVRGYKCPFCPKAFKTSVQLAGHKNSHTKPFSCQQCNRPFASLYAVRVHMEVHARQNSLKFSCTKCGASYARAFALKDHMRQAHDQEDLPLINDLEYVTAEMVVP